MGTRLWKDVLHPGRQRDRYGNWFTISPRQTAEALRNCRLMLDRGVRVPAVWEHQSTAEPVELSRDDRIANYARNTFGSIVGAKRDDRGVLWLLHDVEDPADVKQLKKTKFVSPKLFPGYSDSRGGEYHGTTIAHVAATPTPVQFWQGGNWVRELSAGALFLSYTPEEGDMADEAEGKKGDETGGDFGRLVDALRAYGCNVPDSVKDINGLIIAIESQKGGGGDDLDLDLDDEAAAPPADTTAADSGPPMLMSDARAEPLRKRDRVGFRQRIEGLFRAGRVDRPTALKLGRELQAVNLSYTRDGELHNCPLEAKIAAYEELPKGQAWRQTGKPRKGIELSVTADDAPADLTGDRSASENAVLKTQAEIAKRLSSK